jgi:elongation factor P
MQFLYESGEEAVLMDLQDYEQLSLSRSLVGDAIDWIKPNDEVEVLFVDEQPTDIQLPSTVEMAVSRTDPGVRGDTASGGGGTKPATLETGVTVQVPLFVNEGDRVRVDTRTREYVARA